MFRDAKVENYLSLLLLILSKDVTSGYAPESMTISA